jgi:hypothetical protein
MVKSGCCGIGALVRGSAETRDGLFSPSRSFSTGGRCSIFSLLSSNRQSEGTPSINWKALSFRFAVADGGKLAALRLRLAWKGRDRGEF